MIFFFCLIEQPKSATKPQRIEYLDGIEMLDLAAGQNSTFFIARPPPTQAAKEEAKSFVEAAPPPAATATESAAAETPAAPAVKPSYDISGFGFNFGPPAPAAAAASAATATPEATTPEADKKKDAAAGISRTDNAAWEELQRWPPLFEDEACKVCGSAESGGAKGEILECEKVSRSLPMQDMSPKKYGN